MNLNHRTRASISDVLSDTRVDADTDTDDVESPPTVVPTVVPTVKADLFDDAQRRIVTLMMRDPFVRFQAAVKPSAEAKV